MTEFAFGRGGGWGVVHSMGVRVGSTLNPKPSTPKPEAEFVGVWALRSFSFSVVGSLEPVLGSSSPSSLRQWKKKQF